MTGTKGLMARMLQGALLMDNGMHHHCVAIVSEAEEFDII